MDGTTLQRHPWEEARYRFFSSVLNSAGLLTAGTALLDVGAGDAWLAGRLADEVPQLQVTCWDTAYELQSAAALERLPRAVRIVASNAIPDIAASVVLLLDVLEHVPDDHVFFRQIVSEVVRHGGHVLVSVPAWPLLYTSHDRRLKHHRRYTPKAMRLLLTHGGVEVVRSGGLFHSLLIPRALQAVREKLGGRAYPPADLGHWRASAWVTRAVGRALALDCALSRTAARVNMGLPGLSWWALCRKS